MSGQEHWDSPWVLSLQRSYRALLGEELAQGRTGTDAARWLYAEAPFALLSHDAGPDPRFVYANLRAQRCFEYAWEELVGMPSRLSAAPADRAEREAFLSAVAAQGFTRSYRGVRIAKSGRRFWIENVALWNVLDPSGRLLGQAAAFAQTRPAEPRPARWA